MLSGRRFRVRFTPDQLAYADEVAGVCRAVWNTGLDQRRQYRQRRAWINYPEQCRELAEAKGDPEFVWLKRVPGYCLQQTVKDLEQACRTHGTWKVKFRSKARWSPAFRFPEGKHMRVHPCPEPCVAGGRDRPWCRRGTRPVRRSDARPTAHQFHSRRSHRSASTAGGPAARTESSRHPWPQGSTPSIEEVATQPGRDRGATAVWFRMPGSGCEPSSGSWRCATPRRPLRRWRGRPVNR